MKRLSLLLAALMASAAIAQTTVPVVIPPQTLTVTIPPQTLQITVPQQSVTITIPTTSTPPVGCTSPQPDNITQTVVCPAGTTGNWTQTQTYSAAAYPTCWTAGAFAPSGPPAGSCPPVVITPPPVNPTTFLMTNQGQNSASFAWPAVAGATYNLYRNGFKLVGGLTGTTYTDTTATNITTPGYGPEPFVAATIYKYSLTSVINGVESAPVGPTMWVYHQGIDNWTMTQNNYNGSTVNFSVTDTSGAPQAGSPTDVMITVIGGPNWFQPYSGAPFLTAPVPFWAMELGSFNTMTIDLKPTRAGQTWTLNLISRITAGDNYNSAVVTLGDGVNYGPASQVGKWATYKIPFSALQVGVGAYTGSISGNTLTVTALGSGINVQGSSYLSGGTIVQGSEAGKTTTTYLNSTSGNPAQGGPGTYTVTPSQTIASTKISAQRTNMYKFSLQDPSGTAGNVYYVDNIGFTP